jgi:GNAT superfamily N-acetyltransferase
MERRPRLAAVRIRAARTDEAAALTGLSLRSKAYWGYEPEFLRACADELRIDPALLDDARQVWRVAVDGTRVAGVYGLAPKDADTVELEALFVEPDAIRAGVGASLVEDALCEARARGYERVVIQGDPNAAGFYIAVGAKQIGERESASIPGRFLPLFELDVPDTQQATSQET